MRRSRFKHVFGKPNKREFCYDNIRITTSSWDSTFCSVNPKFIAVITESAGGGSFLVMQLEKYGRVDYDAGFVAGHKAAVLDIQWCPFNDNLIASASEDCTVKLWLIPDQGIVAGDNMTEPAADLLAHQRRVGLVQWHPTAEHVLLSAGADNLVCIWNVFYREVLKSISFPDMILSVSFNWIGSLFACTCKDKRTRIVDPRSGEIKAEGQCHEGNKPQRVTYVRNGRIVTTGFSKMSERQVAIFNETDLSKPLEMVELDTSNGVMFPLFDFDTNLLYLCGKGDSQIRYFEIFDEAPYILFLSMFQSSDPQRGIGFMPKRGLDVNANEIARIYKLHTKGLCEIIPFTVPRKSELFQEDLYPDTAGDEPSLTAADWLAGRDAEPILVSLRGCFKSAGGAGGGEAGHAFQTAITTKKRASVAAAASATTAVSPVEAKKATPLNHTSSNSSKPANQTSAVAPATVQSSPTANQSSSSASVAAANQSSSATVKATNQSSSASVAAPAAAARRPSQPANQLTASTTPAAATPQPTAAGEGVQLSAAEIQQLMDDMRKLKIIIKGHEKRIKSLELRLAALSPPQS